jgi:hypothetical protein
MSESKSYIFKGPADWGDQLKKIAASQKITQAEWIRQQIIAGAAKEGVELSKPNAWGDVSRINQEDKNP